MKSEKDLSRDTIARELEENLSSLLGLDAGTRIDPKRRFEAMGVDSLLGFDLLTALEARYGALPETVLRDNPTLHQLTDYLHKKQSGG
jgi:rhizoxin synthesis polyketide synthase/nonribosomal peptide synthetase RhiB